MQPKSRQTMQRKSVRSLHRLYRSATAAPLRSKKVCRSDAQGVRQRVQVANVHVALPSLDLTDVRPVQTSEIRQSLLRELASESLAAYGGAHVSKPPFKLSAPGLRHKERANLDAESESTESAYHSLMGREQPRWEPTPAPGGIMYRCGSDDELPPHV